MAFGFSGRSKMIDSNQGATAELTANGQSDTVATDTVATVETTKVATTVLGELSGWSDCEVRPLKPAVDGEALLHRQLLRGEFWRHIPAYSDVDTDLFLDHSWQARNSVTSTRRLRATLGDLVSEGFYSDMEAGYHRAPMSIRVSPYLLALMDWSDPY